MSACARRHPRHGTHAGDGVRQGESNEGAHPEAAAKVLKGALTKGLLTLKAGLYNNCVRLHHPLTTEEELLERGLTILEDAIKKVE